MTDASGGTLSFGDAGGTVLVYTMADGTEVRSVIDPVDGGYVPSSAQAVPFGDDLSSFLFVVERTAAFSEDPFYKEFGLLKVTISPNGQVSSTLSDTGLWSVTGELDAATDLALVPLGDGRVGFNYAHNLGGNIWTTAGLVTESEIGAPEVTTLEGADAGRAGAASFVLLEDGGLVLFRSFFPDEMVRVSQFDAEGTPLEDGVVEAGVDSGTTFAYLHTIVQDEATGELAIYYSGAPDGGSGAEETYVTLLDLVPFQDEIPGEPVPPEEPVYDEVLEGTEAADDLRGGVGDDAIYGNGGDDFLRGNHDNDEMFGGADADDMNGGFGDDYVEGGAGDDKIGGFDGADQLYGGDGDDRLHGGRGDDALYGGDGNDEMRGAEGADTLSGGAGDDLLIGGEGADVFAWELETLPVTDDDTPPTPEDVIALDNGTDMIKDFTIGEDKIALTSGAFFADEPANPPLTFDDIFLSQEDSAAVIEIGETVIRLERVDADDLSEDDFILI